MSKIDMGSFVRPYPGQRVSGDATFLKEHDQGYFACIIDGMGHGENAHQMAEQVISHTTRHWSPDIKSCLEQLNKDMQGSLGAAVGMAFINLKQMLISCATIGNTKLRVIGEQSNWGLASDGILGQYKRSIKTTQLNFELNDLILLYTDGLSSFFPLDEYPGNLQRDDCTLIVRNLVHQFGKRHDDASCIALRYRS